MSSEREYDVNWSVNLMATTPASAAQQAWLLQNTLGHRSEFPSQFTVQDKTTGDTVTITINQGKAHA